MPFGIQPSSPVVIFLLYEKGKKHLLFSPSLLAKRWTKDYMKDVYYKKSDSTAETSCNVSGAKFSAIEFKHLAA